MKKYRVIAKFTEYYEAFIEAENENEAWIEANKMDGAEFEPLQEVDTWEIGDVYEQEEV
mgnify:FL=1